jgi:photosystem II stability/assembly factor-like uncharacterized protein
MNKRLFFSLLIGISFICATALWQCEHARCNDGRRNGNEEFVDCGGDCPPCYTCDDGFKNQDETQTDCGGYNCDFCPEEWQPLPPPDGKGFNDLFALNDEVLFAAGFRHIGKSTDGGKTWAITDLPIAEGWLIRIHFYDALNGVALGVTAVQGAGGFGFTMTTGDGGQTWTYHYANVSSNSFHYATFAPPYRVFGYHGFDNQLVVSTNGGQTFNLAQLPGIPTNLQIGYVRFFGESDGVALAFGGSTQNFVYKTINGGTSWSLVGSAGQISPLSFKMEAPSVATATTAQGARISTDGGQSWRALDLPNVGSFRAYFFADAQTGYCLGDELANDTYLGYKSADAGSTWQPFGLYNRKRWDNAEYPRFNIRAFRQGKTVYAVGGGVMKVLEK